MTTTTRTTRRAPWAVVLTALLAVLALAFGVLTVATPATAKNDPDKTPPGQSETFVPPGQDDDFVPPGQDDRPTTEKKVWICHADVNNNGDAGLADGSGGEFRRGYNLIYISWSAWENAHNRLHPNDVIADTTSGTPVCPADVVTYACPTGTAKAGTAMDHAYDPANAADVAFCGLTEEQAAEIEAALNAPATVAPVLPGTIEEPEAVAIPAPATIPVAAKPLPATVPAGDGATVPTAPTGLLALLALAATTLAVSSVRLVRSRS